MWIILAILELLFINLFTIDRTLKRKNDKKSVIIAVMITLILTTIIVVSIIMSLKKSPFYINGSGIFLFIGLIYIIPIHLMYDNKFIIKCIAALFGYTYGIAVFTISVRICYLVNINLLSYIFLIVQTILFAITYYAFIKVINKWVYFTKMNIKKSFEKKLFFFSFCLFLFLVFANIMMVYSNNNYMKLTYSIIIVITILISYKMSFEYYYEQEKTQKLAELIQIDQLTNLKNRLAFQKDLEKICEKYDEFLVIYIDLDSFKNINDQYGHLVGDDYLINFSGALKKICLDECELYHISGDEFTIIYYGVNKNEFIKILDNLKVNSTNGIIEFLGFSYGISQYTGKDIDLVIKDADYQMYMNKKKKKQIR